MKGLNDNGYNPIPIDEIKRLLDLFPYGDPYRVYLLLLVASGARPGEVAILKWDDLNPVELSFSYFPPKQSKYNRKRRFDIGPILYKELMHYKRHNPVKDNKLFDFSYYAFKRQFDKLHRSKLKGGWVTKIPYKTKSVVQERYLYTFRGIRTTIGTLAFIYLSHHYNEIVALGRVSRWLGHKSTHMTLDFYIRHLDIVKVPKHFLSSESFEILIDLVIYKERQTTLDEVLKTKTRQTKLLEFEKVEVIQL